MASIYFHHKRHSNIYSFLAGALAPFLAGRGFWDLATTAARRRAALVRSFLYLLVEDGLDLVQGPPGTSLHGGGNHGLGRSETILGSLGGPHESLVGSSWADTNNLVVDESVVSHGIDVGQVAGLSGEWLLDSPLLQQEAAVVADDGPGDIRGNHDLKDCFSCRSESSNI